MVKAADLRGRTLIWMGIGLGFGPRDLSVIRAGQLDRRNYDLRCGKTGIERFGRTPPLVWSYVRAYLKEEHLGLVLRIQRGFDLP